MFLDMATLIASQGRQRQCARSPKLCSAGEMIDRIEMSVSTAQDYVSVRALRLHLPKSHLATIERPERDPRGQEAPRLGAQGMWHALMMWLCDVRCRSKC